MSIHYNFSDFRNFICCPKQFCCVDFFWTDYESKIDDCRKKTEAAQSEVVGDEELDLLLKELEEEHKKESLLLEELR